MQQLSVMLHLNVSSFVINHADCSVHNSSTWRQTGAGRLSDEHPSSGYSCHARSRVSQFSQVVGLRVFARKFTCHEGASLFSDTVNLLELRYPTRRRPIATIFGI
jgi:hypothetical protein